MNALVPVLILSTDTLLVAGTAWLGICAANLHRRGLVQATLGWLLLALAWLAGSGVLLGMAGGLGRLGFLALHAAALAAMLAYRRGRISEDLWNLEQWFGGWWRLGRSGTLEGYVASGIALVLVVLAILSAQAEPVVYDALTYRLSRIGAWLQEGSIRHLATDDPRLNYMPLAPDVVIAWLLGATSDGFRLAPLAQLAGGILLLGATYGLAQLAGLSRRQSLGAVGILAGMANVAVQFTTIQSDLFTAGAFAAAYLLWHRALLRGEGSWLAGIGVALAFGSKGTMFYLAPGAALWVGWLVWQHREKGRTLLRTMAGFVAGALLLLIPGWWQNQVEYGSPLGPRDAVTLHHGSFDSPAGQAEKLVRNLGTSAVQLFDPTAQPAWLQGASRTVGDTLTARLSAEADPYVFIGQSRRDQLERVMRLTEPDADVVTCGLLGAAGFVAGLLLALVQSKRSGAKQVLVWAVGVMAYLITQHALVQWHHWAFRFMVIAAPWVAVIGAWAWAAIPGKLRVAAWAIILGSALQVFATVQVQAGQAAWSAANRPARSASYFQYQHWRAWTEQLDQPDAPLTAVFPIDRPLAAFYRLESSRPVILRRMTTVAAATAEEMLGSEPGWWLLPADRFMGREGRVMGRVGPFNLAGYRRLLPGEGPKPLLYSNRLLDQGATRRREVLIRTWRDVPVRLELFNPAAAEIRFSMRSPTGEVSGTLAAGARGTWEIPIPADILTVVTIDFPKDASTDDTAAAVMVRVAP